MVFASANMIARHLHVRLICSVLPLILLGLILSPAALFAEPASPQAAVPMEQLFPDSTKGFLAIGNMKALADQWRQTRIGQLVNDPIMQEFKEDFRTQMAGRLEKRFGMSLDAIQELPSGELGVGMIAIPGQTPGYALAMDVNNRHQQTKDYLDRLTTKLTTGGAVKTTEKYKNSEIIAFAFPDQSQATKTKVDKNAAKLIDRHAYILLSGRYLVVTDQLSLVKLMYDRLEAAQNNDIKGSLSQVPDYQHVIKKCVDDIPKQSNYIIRWYIEPLNYGESIRVLMRGPLAEKRKNKPSIFSILKEQGFDAIRSVGGVVGIKVENKETVYRIFIHAPKPYRLAMRMLTFPDSTNFSPARWMPTDLARCSMFYVDPIAIFDNFGSLFDALVMQGETGVWNDIIDGLEKDPNGPQINLREELVVHLGHRILGMSKYQLPITPNSESIVVCIELNKNSEAVVEKSLEKLFGNDTDMQKTVFQDYTLWHRVPAEDLIMPETDLSGVPSLVQSPSISAAPAADEEEKDAEPFFPEGAITVAKGCMFFSTDCDFLKSILERLTLEEPSIADQDDYKKVDMIFAGMGVTSKPHFMQFFSRTAETIQPTYELFRQGKMPQSRTVLGKAINALFVPEEERKDPNRRQLIDGSKLPEFERIRHYFGLSGLYGATEEDGFFFKGFLVEKENTTTGFVTEKIEPQDTIPASTLQTPISDPEIVEPLPLN